MRIPSIAVWIAGFAFAAQAPDSLTHTADFAKQMYSAANTNDWTAVDAQFPKLREAVMMLWSQVPQNLTEQQSLAACLDGLRDEIAGRDQQQVIRDSNQVTRIAADLLTQYDPQAGAVARIGYFGRELEILARWGDSGEIQNTSNRLSQTWENLRGQVIARGGGAEAQRLDTIIRQIDTSNQAWVIRNAAEEMLGQLPALERVFTN